MLFTYFERKRIVLWTRYGEELDEGVGLIEVKGGVERRWERLFAKVSADERRMSGFDGQDGGIDFEVGGVL